MTDALGVLQLLERAIELPASSTSSQDDDGDQMIMVKLGHDAAPCHHAEKIAELREEIRALAPEAYHVALMSW